MMILVFRKKNKIKLIQEVNSYYKENIQQLYSYVAWACGNKGEAANVFKQTLKMVEEDIHSKKAIKCIKYNFLRALHYQCEYQKSLSISAVRSKNNNDHVGNFDNSFQLVLKQVPDRYSQPLMMQIIGQFSITEISNTLLISVHEASIRLSAARRMVFALAALEETINSSPAEIKTTVTPAKHVNYSLADMESENRALALTA